MANEEPVGTLRELALKIQQSIANAKAAEDAQTTQWKRPAGARESFSETREKIRQANDF